MCWFQPHHQNLKLKLYFSEYRYILISRFWPIRLGCQTEHYVYYLKESMWTYSCIGCVLYHLSIINFSLICFEHFTTTYDSPDYFYCSVWGVINIVFFNLILGLMALSHVRAMTCDPGMVSTLQNNQPDFALIQTDKYKQQVCKFILTSLYGNSLTSQNSILRVSIWYLYKKDARILPYTSK